MQRSLEFMGGRAGHVTPEVGGHIDPVFTVASNTDGDRESAPLFDGAKFYRCGSFSERRESRSTEQGGLMNQPDGGYGSGDFNALEGSFGKMLAAYEYATLGRGRV